MKIKNHNVLLLCVPTIPNRGQGINRLAAECGWNLRIESISAPPKDWSGDGVLIMLNGTPGAVKYARKLQRRGIPIVDMLEDSPEVDIPRVTGDDVEIGRLAARHLNDRLFRHAAFFSATNDKCCHPARRAGFEDAWQGETFDTWIWPEIACGREKGNWNKMQQWLAKKLEQAPKPFAVFAWNDGDSVHALHACQQAKLRVPEDVAIIGVDNWPPICERQSVKLTSVAHNLKRIGYVAAAMLERLMCGGKIKTQLTRIKPQGVVTRASTGPMSLYNNDLHRAIEYIDENLSHSFGAAEIAETLKIQRNKLDRLFASALGHSVGTEINIRRIAKAKHLLECTEQSVESVSKACGYCNVSFFSKKFRMATNTTPLAYRKR